MKKAKVNKYSCPFLTAVLLLISTALAFAQPVVPGFNVEVYANISGPVSLAFDPTGVLYVGNNDTPDPVPIRRVGIGGSPVEDFGPYLHDPDSVLFDAAGGISGTPGSVFVSGSEYSGGVPIRGYLTAIAPDETATTIYSTLYAPQQMVFDFYGRLLIPDQNIIYEATSEGLYTFVQGLSGAMAVDGAGQIFVIREKKSNWVISILSRDGDIINEQFSVLPGDISYLWAWGSGMVFTPYDSTWQAHLIVTERQGKIYRVDQKGAVILLGYGFDFPGGLAFGPDDTLYVSDVNANVIYRITPKEIALINNLVDFQPDPSTFSTESNAIGCPDGYLGKFNFMAKLDNTSNKELSNLQIEVNELSNNNVLLTTEGFVRQGERFNVPKRDGLVDGLLGPSESVDVPFIVCLTEIKKFRFFVDVFGSQ